MATNSKRLHPMSLVGLVFMISGVFWFIVGKHAIAAVMLAVGAVLMANGVASARKAAARDEGATPPASGEAGDR